LYYEQYGRYIEYEQQNKNNNNNNNGDNANNYMPICRWFQFRCRQQLWNYINSQDEGRNNNNDNQVQLPDWYRFLGGTTEEDRRAYEKLNLQSTGVGTAGTQFVYTWTLLMFVGMLGYGAMVLHQNRPGWGLIVALAVFAQFMILMIVLLAQGVILTDNRDLENSFYGFYGQMPILIAYTNLSYFWFCVVFAVVLTARNVFFASVYPDSSSPWRPLRPQEATAAAVTAANNGDEAPYNCMSNEMFKDSPATQVFSQLFSSQKGASSSRQLDHIDETAMGASQRRPTDNVTAYRMQHNDDYDYADPYVSPVYRSI